MISDEALMLEFQAGSRAAFEELFARYHKPLYGFFGRRLNNPERAEDLAQETFLAVIHAASRYEPRALVRTYLYGIALKLLAAERHKFLTSTTSGQSCLYILNRLVSYGKADTVLHNGSTIWQWHQSADHQSVGLSGT